jgi:hypothetical protein
MKLRAARGTAAAADAAPEQSCGSCRYFCQSPHEIESQMPGMRSLGSGHASVRAADGICRRHDRYLGAASLCAGYEHRSGGQDHAGPGSVFINDAAAVPTPS